MVELVERVREGFETMKGELDEMKANIETEKQIEREAFERSLEEKYADRAERIENILAQIVYTEEVEVPDEVDDEQDELEDPVLQPTTL